MKKIFMGLGIVFAIIIVASVILLSIVFVKGSALDKEANAYVDKVVPIILADLKKETLFEYSSDQLKTFVPDEQMDKTFALFKKLGTFVKYNGSEGGTTMSVTSEYGKRITGYYEATADFSNGPATIKVTLIKNGDKWEILGFYINSKGELKGSGTISFGTTFAP